MSSVRENPVAFCVYYGQKGQFLRSDPPSAASWPCTRMGLCTMHTGFPERFRSCFGSDPLLCGTIRVGTNLAVVVNGGVRESFPSLGYS